jgi:hypothetical protein
MSEPIPEYGGCPWPVDPACLTEEWEALDPLVQNRALALASETLRRLTGYRVGGCPTTIRPCQRGGCWSAFIPFQGLPFNPGMNVQGNWVNNGCGCNGRGCATSCEIALPPPVGRVEEIKIDGVVLPSTDYMVQNNIVVYTGDDECPFPASQDLSKPDADPGTFSIMGAHAAGLLAVEFAKACGMNGKCTLPPTVREVVRNGVSFTITPGMFPEGFTGIRLDDAYISLWRSPDSPTQPPRVWSPDMRSLR